MQDRRGAGKGEERDRIVNEIAPDRESESGIYGEGRQCVGDRIIVLK